MKSIFTLKSKLLLVYFALCTGLVFAQTPGELDTSFNTLNAQFQAEAGTNNAVTTMALQADGKIIIGGDFAYYNEVGRSLIARLNPDSTLDTTFNPGTGFNFGVEALILRPDNKILVVGGFNYYNDVARNGVALLNTDGSLDTSLDPGLGANGSIRCVALQADGKIIIAGDFTEYNGVARNRIARINADGTLDTSFNPGTGPNNSVRSIALQADGKVVVGGYFTYYNGQARNHIARLNTNGTLDTTFADGTGVNDWVLAMATQPDGKILIGGWFSTYNGTTRNGVARINTDGSLDTTFNPGTTLEGGNYFTVYSLLLLADGKIMAGGDFTTTNSLHKGITRLNADGTPDTAFNPGDGANDDVYAMVQDTDGNIVVGGNYYYYDGHCRNFICRIDANGTLDQDFGPGKGTVGFVNAFAIQPDNKIILAGSFYAYNGVLLNGITRVHPNGDIDTSFDAGTGTGGDYNAVNAVVLQPDGKIIIGGIFTSVDGVARQKVARLNADGSLDTTFNPGTGPDGAESMVNAMVLQPDGKVIIAGQFLYYGGIDMRNIARLNTDGSLDTTFDTSMSLTNWENAWITSVALQPDGKVIAGGAFFYYDNENRDLIRLNTNGSIDTTFSSGSGASAINTLALQPDGKIVIGGSFGYYNATQRRAIARVNTDGSVDTTFDPGEGASYRIESLAIQPDGKIIIGGLFNNYNWVPRARIARINTDGTLDTTFDPGLGVGYTYTDGVTIYDVALQPDGQILISGIFNMYGDVFRNKIARVNGGDVCTTPLPQGEVIQTFVAGATIANLVVTGTEIQWYDAEGNIIPANTPLVDSTTYYATQTIDDCESEPLAITVDVTMNLDGFSANKLTYYPNPVQDTLHIVSDTTIEKVEVYTLIGQKILQADYNTQEAVVNMGNVTGGSYLVRVFNSAGSNSFMVIRQ